VKLELAGFLLSHDSFQKSWEGIFGTSAKDEFASTLPWWLEQCEKSVSGSMVTMSENNTE
jgi:hypothetical protein